MRIKLASQLLLTKKHTQITVAIKKTKKNC